MKETEERLNNNDDDEDVPDDNEKRVAEGATKHSLSDGGRERGAGSSGELDSAQQAQVSSERPRTYPNPMSFFAWVQYPFRTKFVRIHLANNYRPS